MIIRARKLVSDWWYGIDTSRGWEWRETEDFLKLQGAVCGCWDAKNCSKCIDKREEARKNHLMGLGE